MKGSRTDTGASFRLIWPNFEHIRHISILKWKEKAFQDVIRTYLIFKTFWCLGIFTRLLQAPTEVPGSCGKQKYKGGKNLKRLHHIPIALVVLMLTLGGTALASHQYGKGQVNVNTATRDQLVWFLGQSGIGHVDMIADNILAFREANGPLDEVTDLMKVKGISQAVFDRIKFRVKVSGDTEYDPEAVTPAPGKMNNRDDLHESS
jgi:competence ComEA-like helix-hairpin-helix protein